MSYPMIYATIAAALTGLVIALGLVKAHAHDVREIQTQRDIDNETALILYKRTGQLVYPYIFEDGRLGWRRVA